MFKRVVSHFKKYGLYSIDYVENLEKSLSTYKAFYNTCIDGIKEMKRSV